MLYNVWLLTDEGKPSAAGPSRLYADGITDAQKRAETALQGCQAAGVLIGWTIQTVTEAG